MIAVGALVVHRDVVSHPLLGDAHIVEHAGEPITAMSAIDWDRPTQIPTIAEPRRLPRGSGTLLINEIAKRARDAGVSALRYAGPYPTPALYRSLLKSFRAAASEDAFTADVLGRALRLAHDEIAVDFAPAPFERRTTARGFADLRDGVERVQIDGIPYDREGTPGLLTRLVDHSAVLVVGNTKWADVARVDDVGDLVAGPHPIPSVPATTSFPTQLAEVLADLVADLVPAPLADDARRFIVERPVGWSDLGWRAGARDGNGFALHAAHCLLVREPRQFALAVAQTLAHLVTSAILDALESTRAS